MTSTCGLDLRPFMARVQNSELLPWSGEVVELVGMLVASRGPAAAVGDFCEVLSSSSRRIRTQVIGFRLAGELFRCRAGGHQPIVQIRVAAFEDIDEAVVEAHQAVAAVKVLEPQIKAKRETFAHQ